MTMLEKRHTNLSTNLSNLGSISSSHPFTQQIDIVFPSGWVELENALSALNTRYAKGNLDLAQVLATGPSFIHPYTPSLDEHDGTSQSQSKAQYASDILALSVNQVHEAFDDDVWCIDTRGVLTICVCKETYERLGLVGQKLPFKHQSGGRYVISLPLHENAESVPVQTRRRNALESWDADFAPNVTAETQSGPSSLRPTKGIWEVIYCSTAPVDVNITDSLDRWTSQVHILNPIIRNVACEKTYLENVWIPNLISLSPRTYSKQEEEEEYEDWEYDISALFEWVGMAGLHADRLQANDRVDPFVALYEPPHGSRVGNLTHLRWRGLLSPTFVQAIINTSVAFLQSSQYPLESLVAITVHGITNSPVVYLPSPRLDTEKSSKSNKRGSASAAPRTPPAHLPSKDGEDTWCLVLASPEEEQQDVRSILYESVGQWDARWG